MKWRMTAVVIATILAGSAWAEFRVWTGRTGSRIEAELLREADGRVVLRDRSGRELKVPRSYLSEADITYLDNTKVPVIVINPSVRLHSEYQPGQGVVQMIKYDIDVRQVSSDVYEAPLQVTLCLIGTIGKENNLVMLQKTSQEARFSSAQRRLEFTGPDLSLGSPDLQKKYDITYYGYLVTVATTSGRIVQLASDLDLLEANAGAVLRFKPGALFGTDMKPIE